MMAMHKQRLAYGIKTDTRRFLRVACSNFLFSFNSVLFHQLGPLGDVGLDL